MAKMSELALGRTGTRGCVRDALPVCERIGLAESQPATLAALYDLDGRRVQALAGARPAERTGQLVELFTLVSTPTAARARRACMTDSCHA
jgi:hypothetical protein